MVRRRRGQYDPLQSVDRPMWLVVKDLCNRPIRITELAPKSDLRAALSNERQRMMEDGWQVDELTWLSFAYATRDGDRVCINIQALHPDEPTVGHGTHLCGTAPGK